MMRAQTTTTNNNNNETRNHLVEVKKEINLPSSRTAAEERARRSSSIKIMLNLTNNGSVDNVADNSETNQRLVAISSGGSSSDHHHLLLGQWQCPKVFPADSATVNMPATAVLGSKYINLTKNLAENHRNEKNVENHSWFNNSVQSINVVASSSSSTPTMFTNSNQPDVLLAKINNNLLSQRNLEQYTSKLLPMETSTAIGLNLHHNLNESKTPNPSLDSSNLNVSSNSNGSEYRLHEYFPMTTTANNDLTLSPLVQNRIKTNGSLSRERKSPFQNESTHLTTQQQQQDNVVASNSNSDSSNGPDKLELNIDKLDVSGGEERWQSSKSSYENIVSGRTLMKSPRTKIRTTYMSTQMATKKDVQVESPATTSSMLRNQQTWCKYSSSGEEDNNCSSQTMEEDHDDLKSPNILKMLNSSSLLNDSSIRLEQLTNNGGEDASSSTISSELHSLRERITMLERQEKCILNEIQMELSMSAMETVNDVPVVDETKLALEQELLALQQKIHRLESQRNATRVMEENKQAKLKQSMEMKEDQLKKLTVMLEKNRYDACLQEEYHKLKESLENDSHLFEDLEFQYLEEESEWHGYREELNAEMKALVLKVEEKRYEGEHQKLHQDLNKMALNSKSEMLNDQLLKVLKDLAISKEQLKVFEQKNEDIEEPNNHKNKKSSMNSMNLSNSLELLSSSETQDHSGSSITMHSSLMSMSVNENLIFNNRDVIGEKAAAAGNRTMASTTTATATNTCLLNNSSKTNSNNKKEGEEEKKEEKEKPQTIPNEKDLENHEDNKDTGLGEESPSAKEITVHPEIEDGGQIGNRSLCPVNSSRVLKRSNNGIEMMERKQRNLPRHQRPLTRYLPIFSSNLDLRQHIESAGHQITMCPHVFLDANSCRGYLHKLGATFHGWSKRWFVLDRQREVFIYYADKSERKARGGAYFATIQEVYLDHLNASKSGRPHCTFVVKAKERSYQLQAASAAAARIWIDVITTAAQANPGY